MVIPTKQGGGGDGPRLSFRHEKADQTKGRLFNLDLWLNSSRIKETPVSQ